MTFENKSGVFVVRYDTPGELSPDQQADLVAALRNASIVDAIGVLFVVSPTVQMVGHEVPEYWMGITGDGGIRVSAIAVVTPNPAVSVATRGFSTANILKSTSVAVKPFQDEASALAWVRAELAGAKSKGARAAPK